VFLTTHLMEEAERLCDRVAIIEHGRVIEMGTPAELVARHCPERRVFYSTDGEGGERMHELSGEGDDFVTEVIHQIASDGARVRGFRTEVPTLEDVFLKLTGHAIRD
jgi:ABC-2 type transport system ATP-binding protein